MFIMVGYLVSLSFTTVLYPPMILLPTVVFFLKISRLVSATIYGWDDIQRFLFKGFIYILLVCINFLLIFPNFLVGYPNFCKFIVRALDRFGTTWTASCTYQTPWCLIWRWNFDISFFSIPNLSILLFQSYCWCLTSNNSCYFRTLRECW